MPASASRHRARAVALAVGCALLAGCGNPTSNGPGPSVTSTAPPAGGAASVPGESPDPARWGAYGTRERACSAVTDDVVSLSLLPTSLAVSHGAEDVRRMEDHVRDVAEAVPPPLRPHFTRIRELVGSYGDAVAAGETARPSPGEAGSPGATRPPGASPMPGAGTARPVGPSPATTPPEFDERALERSLEPVRQWLRSSCSGAVPLG